MLTKNELLKNFAIGFIPIFIFILVDEFYGTKAGLIVAIVAGLLYMIYYYIRFRRIEKMILFDTALILLMGSVSLILQNELFFKLKPALIELILVVLVGVHAFSSRPLLLNMSKRYMGQVEFQPAQLKMMRQLSRLLFVVLLIHTLLIVYSAYFWSKEAWAFISGGLFYILFGLIIAGQWIYMKFFKKPFNDRTKMAAAHEEWFDLVDEKGKIVGKAPRSAVHGNPALIHPVVHLHIFNNQGKLYLQKRSQNKDLYPGYWDTAVGGHVLSGESVDQALAREAREELGISINHPKALFRYFMRNKHESELVHSFSINHNGPFKINRNEIEVGRFWTIFEIKKMIGNDVFTPNFEQEFALLQKSKMI